MNSSSEGEMRKNEMFADDAPPRDGILLLEALLRLLHLTRVEDDLGVAGALDALGPAQFGVYSSIANETSGFCSM